MIRDQVNQIHPTAIIKNSLLGTHNYVGPFTVIENAVIGDGNCIESHVSIGSPAEHRDQRSTKKVIIGNNNKINEFVTINQGIDDDTKIGNDCYIMAKAHIGHDAIIMDRVTLSCLSIVGGHSIVMVGANCGLGTVIHQKRVIGAHSMIGMNSTVSKSIPPFMIAKGTPCKFYKVNEIGMLRNKFRTEDVDLANLYLGSNCSPDFFAGGIELNAVLIRSHATAYRDFVKNLGGK